MENENESIGVKTNRFISSGLFLISKFVAFIFMLGSINILAANFCSSGTGMNFQERKISGTVTDALGQALPGVNIIIKGTQRGTITDAEGKYSIVVKSNDAVLVFSYVGFLSKEILIGDKNVVDVQLEEDIQGLEEVVAVGYGTERKKDITGAVSVVNMKELKAMPAVSADRALQGLASGVNVISSGVPGAESKIFIRGVSSFGNTQPLILVDGVQGSLENINPEDIESMQVLKDAGAASIYGVRGSNGVIIITTKKGKTGKPVFSYNVQGGIQLPLPGNPFNRCNSEEFKKVTLIADPNSQLFAGDRIPDYGYGSNDGRGVAMEGDPAVDPARYNFDPTDPNNNYLIQKFNKTGTDWFHEVFNPALVINQSLTASGGTEKSKYLFSVEYLNQQGTLMETGLKRYAIRVNTEFGIGGHFRIGENMHVFYKDNPGFNNNSEWGTIAGIYMSMPIIPVYDIQGNFGGTYAGIELGHFRNPVAAQKRTVNDRRHSWNTVGNVYGEVDFLKYFSFKTSFGITYGNLYNQDFHFTPYNNVQGTHNPNGLSISQSYDGTLMWTNILNFNREFGQHNVKVLLGSEAIENTGKEVGGSSSNFFSTDFDYLLLQNGTMNISNYSYSYLTTLFSLFGRLDYNYGSRYLIGITLRRDGSSVFGSESRYGLFPAVSFGWRLSNEKFMQNVSWVNDLKIRGSYGIMGSNNNIDPQNAYSLYGGGYGDAYYDIRGTSNSVVQGFYQTRIGNPRTSWEKDKVSNIGFDVTILNYKLNVSLEYYKKAIEGLLFPQPLPAFVGQASPPTINIGDIQNTGFDFFTKYQSSIGNNLQFYISANITTYKNKVVDIPDPGYFDTGYQQSLGMIVRNQEGEEVSSFYGYDVIGLFQDDNDVNNSPEQPDAAPGRFKYRDCNGRDENGELTGKPDGVINEADRTFLGSPNPDFTYGLNLGINFKGFDFSVMFYGSQGNDLVNMTRVNGDFFSTYPGNKSRVLLNAWTPENKDTNVPIIEPFVNFSTGGVFNSYFVENGSYLKLKSLLLGYSFKFDMLQKIKITKLRIYLQAANLFTITKYSGLDPEIGGSSASFGIDYANYPNNEQKFLLGVNVSF